MTIAKVLTSLKLNLKIQTGTNEKGNPIYCVKALSNVDPEAPVAKMHAVAQLVAGLYDGDLASIYVTEISDLQEEA